MKSLWSLSTAVVTLLAIVGLSIWDPGSLYIDEPVGTTAESMAVWEEALAVAVSETAHLQPLPTSPGEPPPPAPLPLLDSSPRTPGARDGATAHLAAAFARDGFAHAAALFSRDEVWGSIDDIGRLRKARPFTARIPTKRTWPRAVQYRIE